MRSKKPKDESMVAAPWLSAFEARDDLAAFGDNALGLFSLGLKFTIDDLETVAAEAITDGYDDKKCDIVYVSSENDYAVIAQCYHSKVANKSSAPANKACDLNTAVNWLLQRRLVDLPDSIRYAAQELRDGITSGQITRIYVWYVHNLPESANVASELKTVEATADAAIKNSFAGCHVQIVTTEVGRNTIAEWYSDTQSPILVSSDYSIDIEDGFEVLGKEWSAYVTAIPLRFLRAEYLRHKEKLFSANVRDYLGSISSDANINNGIKKTAELNPDDFWAFNNGLTILVNNYKKPRESVIGTKLFKFSGMSIVNGAQTTGAIGSLKKVLPSGAKVSARFIKTDSQELVSDIIRYNNSQNKVAASDFRSTDAVQRRLREEMAQIPGAEYDGGRRGGATDAIRRRPNLLASYTVGQALAAMHGDPTVAYNQKSDIWINDKLYGKYFNESTTAVHIVFSFALLRAVEARKIALVKKSRDAADSLTRSEDQQLKFFRRRGSNYLLTAALAASLETFLSQRIPNLHRLSFGPKVSPARAEAHWSEIVNLAMPLTTYLEEAFTHGLQNQERVKAAIQKFGSLIEVTAQSNKNVYERFAGRIASR